MSSTGADQDKSAAGGFVWILFAVGIAAADQATKRFMLATFAPGDTVVVTPFFNLVVGLNRGAAFGLLSEASGWQRPVLLAVATGVSVFLVYLIRRSRSEPLARFGYSLILGGAIGNAVDRARLGGVVDLLDFHLGGWHWPAFNLADAAITVGVGALLAGSVLGSTKDERGPS